MCVGGRGYLRAPKTTGGGGGVTYEYKRQRGVCVCGGGGVPTSTKDNGGGGGVLTSTKDNGVWEHKRQLGGGVGGGGYLRAPKTMVCVWGGGGVAVTYRHQTQRGVCVGWWGGG